MPSRWGPAVELEQARLLIAYTGVDSNWQTKGAGPKHHRKLAWLLGEKRSFNCRSERNEVPRKKKSMGYMGCVPKLAMA